MSITNAFISSRSGLAATAAWSEVTSNNIANADRADYVRRGILLTSGPTGAGVQVEGLRREVDGALDRMHRQEMSRTATQDAIADGLKVHAALLGEPGDPLSIQGRISALQSRLDELSNDPAQPGLQRAALDAAASVASTLNTTSGRLTETAVNTREGIVSDLSMLNRLLSETAEINRQITLREPGTRDSAALEDTLAAKLDEMAQIVDLRVQRQPDGGIVIYTAGGTPLLEGRNVNTVTFSAADGRLFAGDAEITPGVPGARGFEDGRLAGRIALLNDVLPRMQTQLDEAARMLVESFTSADTTLTPGDPGLFTDDGAAFDPLAASGLAARITINEGVRGPGGDTLGRMRDGIGATAPGPQSDSTRIEAMIGSFSTVYALSPEAGLGAQGRLSDFVPAMIADQKVSYGSAQNRAESLRAGAQVLETTRLGFQGVNIDDELQQLMAAAQAELGKERA
ncbi:MAG: flagellar hook-associated protein FlgK, partial [Paracoccaceae bacterium]|nr:flagellar hook-associated protein FlgK [Paracoccaceae bacterium]